MNTRRIFGVFLVTAGLIGLLFIINDSEGNSLFKKLINSFMTEISKEERYDLDSIRNINVDDVSLNVIVRQGTSPEAVVRMEGSISKNLVEDYKLDGRTDGDILHIGTKKRDGWNWFHFSTVNLTIELPEKQWDEFTIDTTSGNITVDQLKSTKLILETNSGNIAANNINGQDMDVRTTSGNIRLLQATADELELKSTSGNITINEYEADQLTINNTSGNIKAIEGSSTLVAKTVSGNITIDTEDLLQDADLKSTSGNVTVTLHNEPKSLTIDYNGSSGRGSIKKSNFSYEIKSNDRDVLKGSFGTGEAELKVRTTSGNFTLK